MRKIPERLRQKDVAAAMDFMSPDPQGVDTSRRRNVQHESAEQRALFQWVQTQPWRDDWFHWPNERRNRAEAHRLKLEGVKRGPGDNWLLLPVCYSHPDVLRDFIRPGAISELKRPGATRSAVSEDQRRFLLRRLEQGWAAGVHRGWVEASEFFRGYVAGDWTPGPEDWWI